MKKVILGLALVFVMNFGLKALAEQTGCGAYCVSVETCCRDNIEHGSGVAKNCERQFGDCRRKYENTPSDQCPEPKSCD